MNDLERAMREASERLAREQAASDAYMERLRRALASFLKKPEEQ